MTTSSSSQPLTQWGGFQGRRRLSDSPYIQSVWEGIALRDGIHKTAADGTIDLTFQTRCGIRRLLLSGPTSKAQTALFEAGDEILTIRLRTGIHIPTLAGTAITDVNMSLPSFSSARFWWQHTALTFPTFDTIETFADHLARLNLLRRDIVVEDALAARIRDVSLRTVQRHFLGATGLTMGRIRQIRRAEQARNLLTGPYTLTAIAYETGYSNPGHMTHAFNYFFGQTPSALRSLMTQVI